MTLPAAAPVHPAWVWWGNPGTAWTSALVGAVIAVAVIYAVMRTLRRRLLPRAQQSGSAVVQGAAAAIDAVRLRYLGPIALIAAAGFLSLPPRADYWLRLAAFVLIGLQLAIAVNRFIVAALNRATSPALGRERPVMLTIITWTIQLVVWLVFLLAVVSALGVDITAFVASLGVGGIAVALALQNILGDLFASVSIGLDKPFEPGDYIAFDTDQGTVTHIGVKSTRIRSLSGEEMAIANSKLLEKLTHNYTRMLERRVAFGFTVPYSTGREQLAAFARRVNDVISGTEHLRLDRGHLTGFGADGFTFEFVYYVLDPDYLLYRDTHQTLMGEIIGIAEDLGVPFTVPTRRVEWRAGGDGPDGPDIGVRGVERRIADGRNADVAPQD
jgi:small-conductance mechanosensitive channel